MSQELLPKTIDFRERYSALPTAEHDSARTDHHQNSQRNSIDEGDEEEVEEHKRAACISSILFLSIIISKC